MPDPAESVEPMEPLSTAPDGHVVQSFVIDQHHPEPDQWDAATFVGRKLGNGTGTFESATRSFRWETAKGRDAPVYCAAVAVDGDICLLPPGHAGLHVPFLPAYHGRLILEDVTPRRAKVRRAPARND